MAATDQTYRNQYTLDIVFAVSSILMLASIVWMLVDDYRREYKTEQREFRDVEVAMAEREALRKMPRKAVVEQAIAEVSQEKKKREANDSKIKELESEIRKQLPEKERADLAMQNIKADLDSKTSFFDIEVEHNGAGSDGAKRLKAEIENIKKQLAAAKADVDKHTDDVKQLQRQKDNLEQPLTKSIGELKKLLDDFDRQVNLAIKKKWGFSDYFRSIPVIEGFASPTKIEQFTLNDLTINYNFKGVTRFDRCTSCHKGIARPTFTRENLEDLWYEKSNEMAVLLKEAEDILKLRKDVLKGLDEGRNVPDPSRLKELTYLSDKHLTPARVKEFSVHPRLDLFVGPNSKHPQEKFGCTICHSGQPSGTAFTFAAHTPNDSLAKQRWIKEHDWEAQHMWDFPMLPQRFVESSCLQCHHQVTDLYSDGNKTEAPKLLKGYNTIREFGCFGCHEISGYKGGRQIGPDLRLEPNPPLEFLTPAQRESLKKDPDNPPGTLRKVGPSLARVSEKTYKEWAIKWILAPREFRADTKMPHYYGLSNNDEKALAGTGQEHLPATEIHGIVHYLFTSSSEFVDQIGKAHDPKSNLQETVDKLKAKGNDKLTAEEKRQFDEAEALLVLRDKMVPLNPKLAELKGDAKAGRDLFTKKGCLACHSHAATNEPDDNWPAAPSEADFGPNLSQVTEKLVKDRKDPKQGKIWLTNWLKRPSNHSPRTRMPITHLSDQEAADIAAWLLAYDLRKERDEKKSVSEDIQGEHWPHLQEKLTPPEPEDLKKLARVYLDRILAESEVEDLFNGKLASYRFKDLGADEKELAERLRQDDKGSKRDKLLYYVGKKAVGRLGCFGCHDIPGFESAKSIGAPLADWGLKDPGRLAFEDINNYVNKHYTEKGLVVDKRVDEDGNPRSVAKGPLYEKFFYDALTHKSREGYLHQKILEPRSFDFNRIRAWDDRSRMPQFKFARLKKKPKEEDTEFSSRKLWAEAFPGAATVDKSAKPRPAESREQFLARKDKEDADDREAVMTFVLGLVASDFPIPLQYTHRPTVDRMAEVKGRQVLDKFNCAGCHTLRPGSFDFKLGPQTVKMLQDLHANNLKSVEYKDDFDFPEHRAWSQQPWSVGPTFTAHGVRPQPLTKDKKARVNLVLTEALHIKTKVAGKDVDVEFRAKDLVSIAPGDFLYPSPEAFKSLEAFQAWEKERGVHGGQFAALLGNYLREDHPDKNKYVEPGPFVPPLLNWQGERTQPGWLYQFLLDPHKVREMTVLRMPKFNMSEDEARQLVDYFVAVAKRANPDLDLQYLPKVPQHTSLDGEFWRQKSAAYVQRLKDAGEYDKEVSAYTAVWNKMREDWAAEAKNATTRAKATKEVADKVKEEFDKEKDEKKKDQLKRDLDQADQNASFWATEKSRLDKLVKEKTLEALKGDWSSSEAYAVAGYRLVVNQCNKCHQVGNLQAQQETGIGPSLNMAASRLRPEWVKRWVAHPQRFVPYNSAMPMYFKASEIKIPLVPWVPGTPLQQVETARDTVLDLPAITELPLTRYWMQLGGGTPEPKKK